MKLIIYILLLVSVVYSQNRYKTINKWSDNTTLDVCVSGDTVYSKWYTEYIARIDSIYLQYTDTVIPIFYIITDISHYDADYNSIVNEEYDRPVNFYIPASSIYYFYYINPFKKELHKIYIYADKKKYILCIRKKYIFILK